MAEGFIATIRSEVQQPTRQKLVVVVVELFVVLSCLYKNHVRQLIPESLAAHRTVHKRLPH